jgi:hypothetical protein
MQTSSDGPVITFDCVLLCQGSNPFFGLRATICKFLAWPSPCCAILKLLHRRLASRSLDDLDGFD